MVNSRRIATSPGRGENPLDITLGGLRPLLDGWTWPPDGSGQFALLALALVGFLALTALYLPLLWRWVGIARLDRKLFRAARNHANGSELHREELADFFMRSPVEFQWKEFDRRWNRAHDPGSLQEIPVRFASILRQWPLLPRGIRRTALDALPSLLVAMGILGAIFVLSLSLGRPDADTGRAAIVQLMAVALQAPLWGLALAILAGVAGRLIQGAFDHYSASLDQFVSCAFSTVLPGESGSLDPLESVEILDFDTAQAPNESDSQESFSATSGLIAEVTEQVSGLIQELRQAGSALQERASAMQPPTPDTVESTRSEIRDSFENEESSPTAQPERGALNTDEFPSTDSRIEAPSDAEEAPTAETRPDTRPAPEPKKAPEPQRSPMISARPSGRWLGPDPFAAREAEEAVKLEPVDRGFESRGFEPSESASFRKVDGRSSLAEASRGLSGLLARPTPRVREFPGKPSDPGPIDHASREPKEAKSSPGPE